MGYYIEMISIEIHSLTLTQAGCAYFSTVPVNKPNRLLHSPLINFLCETMR